MPRVVSYESWPLKCDSAVVQAARVSFGTGLKDYHTDTRLIQYLLRHKHTSPFEMVKFKFHVKAPIFVQRQWFRHRMSNFNEISGRYSKLEPEFYVPDFVGKQSKLNKQASSDENLLDDREVRRIFSQYMYSSKNQYNLYEQLINRGVSKETARIGLPLNMYTEFYWSIDLHNFLNFTRLRSHPGAQPEIQAYSNAAFNLIEPFCPISTKAYNNYIQNSVSFSKEEIDCIKTLEYSDSELQLREKNELKEKVAIINNGNNFK
jgi:thymidylate synthase (FAD)